MVAVSQKWVLAESGWRLSEVSFRSEPGWAAWRLGRGGGRAEEETYEKIFAGKGSAGAYSVHATWLLVLSLPASPSRVLPQAPHRPSRRWEVARYGVGTAGLARAFAFKLGGYGFRWQLRGHRTSARPGIVQHDT